MMTYTYTYNCDDMPEKLSFYDALNQSHCIVVFSTEGIILDANENFLKTMGYSFHEIMSQHHSLFVSDDFKKSQEYAIFWKRLRDGEFFNARVERVHKKGDLVHFEASYNPVRDDSGNVYKVVKFALISSKSTNHVPHELEACNVEDDSPYFIDLSLDQKILNASDSFLKRFSFRISEIQGKDYTCLVHPVFFNIPDYQKILPSLITNESSCKELYRFGLNGKGFWFAVKYKKLEDRDGKIIKIRKFIHVPSDINISSREKLFLAYISSKK